MNKMQLSIEGRGTDWVLFYRETELLTLGHGLSAAEAREEVSRLYPGVSVVECGTGFGREGSPSH